MIRDIIWSPRSKRDYIKLIDYLTEEWGQRSSEKFKKRLQKRLHQISVNPMLYPESNAGMSVRRCVIAKQITLYYRLKLHKVELITFFDTRQHPSKKNLP